jgi:acyl-CoA dehydrogenase
VNVVSLPGLQYDEDHEAFRASVRGLFATEVIPHLTEWRKAGRVPAQLFLSLGEQGFLGTNTPEIFGGGDAEDPRFTCVLIEEAVSVGATGLALVLAHHVGVCIPALLRQPSSDSRSTALRSLVVGQTVAAPAGLDDQLSSQGVAGALSAGLFVVVQVDPAGHRSVKFPPADTAEVWLDSGVLGGLEAGTGEVRFTVDALEVCPAAGKDEAGLLGRDFDLWTAVVAAAGARYALRLALEYVADRKVFGRALSEFENTRLRLAEVAADIATVDASVELCLTRLAAGGLIGAEAAAARIVAINAYERAVDQALQLHGGYGYMREYPIAHAFSDARFVRQAADCMSDPRLPVAAAVGL